MWRTWLLCGGCWLFAGFGGGVTGQPDGNPTAHVLSFSDFAEYKAHHNKTYLRPFNEERGRSAFAENIRLIDAHNAANHSFFLRPNRMADMTNMEYLRSYVRLKSSHHRKIRVTHRSSNNSTTTTAQPPPAASSSTDAAAPDAVGAAQATNVTVAAAAPKMATARKAGSGRSRPDDDLYSTDDDDLPERFDWRDHGFTTGPENQKSCGACYAFSIAYVVLAQLFKRTGLIVRLSAQQLLDCSTSMGNHGCSGGSLRNTLRYVEKAGGVMRDDDYPYTSSQKTCEYNPRLAVGHISSWAILKARDEHAMKVAIARIGPVAVSINASPKTFQLYSHGVYDDDACSASFVNHAMLAIGYTEDAWILKNWWGQKWGDHGYMYIRRGKNMCGLSNYVAYAIV